MNSVSLIGRITREPEVESTGKTTYCKYSIAINKVGQEKVDFINCVAFGKIADNMKKYLAKGSLIGVEGSLSVSSYKRKDGSNASSTEVITKRVQFLEFNKSKKSTSELPKVKAKETGIDYDDIPWEV